MDLYDAYYLGGLIDCIRNVEEFAEVIVKSRKKNETYILLDAFRQISNDLDTFHINGVIRENIDYWITKLSREYKAEQKLTDSDSKELSNAADSLNELISRELLSRPIFEFTETGALNPQALLETSRGESSAIFDKKTWKKLPTIAKSDFSDAAKCLLVEASTPATMVALRGFEAVMRDYYVFRTTNECGTKNLGNIIRELRALPDAKNQLLGYIDYLRSEKRNLAQHPEKTFTQKEAERIFMEIISAVHDIFSEMGSD